MTKLSGGTFLSNIDTNKDNLADILFDELCRPIDTDVDHIRSVRYDEALIVLNYMLKEYSKAEDAGETSEYMLPAEFTPQDRMKDLFEMSLKKEYDWDTETETTKHKKCSIVYTNLRHISDGYKATLSEKIEDIDTLIHEGLNNQCASHGGRLDRAISSDDKFIEQN